VIENQKVTDHLKPIFKGMYSLKDHQNPAVATLKARAIINPEAFVLKPLKEGGGNNFFNEEIA